MTTVSKVSLFVTILVATVPTLAAEGEHPKLIMTKAGVEQIRDNLIAQMSKAVLWSSTIERMVADGVTEIVECVDKVMMDME